MATYYVISCSALKMFILFNEYTKTTKGFVRKGNTNMKLIIIIIIIIMPVFR
jgi:hypothetical protein